jgi:hypothetical protein
LDDWLSDPLLPIPEKYRTNFLELKKYYNPLLDETSGVQIHNLMQEPVWVLAKGFCANLQVRMYNSTVSFNFSMQSAANFTLRYHWHDWQ